MPIMETQALIDFSTFAANFKLWMHQFANIFVTDGKATGDPSRAF